MRTPRFWERKGLLSTALLPLSWLYGLGDFLARRLRGEPRRFPVPVICVGNLTAGGAGKTPTVIALVRLLAERGVDVHVISRGYGGSERGPLHVDLGRHRARDVGDEPLLIASFVPTWISRDRARGVEAAVSAGAELVVLDDGFQNSSIAKDLSLVVVDGPYGFGNGRRLPAGPLREPVARGLARADAVVLIGEMDDSRTLSLPGARILTAKIEPRFSGISLDGVRVFAFAGIGRPHKFFDTVRAQGAHIVDSETFPDHHAYGRALVDRLVARAESQDLMAVTTEKDAVRLPPSTRGHIWPIPVDLVFDNPSQLDALLEPLAARSRSRDVND